MEMEVYSRFICLRCEINWDGGVADLYDETDHSICKICQLSDRVKEMEFSRPSWASIEEVEPEDGEVVWCWDGKTVFFCSFYENDGYFEEVGITHWQSIVKPQPPKEG